MNRHAKTKILLLLLLVLPLTACSDSDLATVAKGLDDTAKAVSVFQGTVINANSQGLLSESSSRQLLEISLKVNAAGQQAVEITRNVSKLDEQDRGKLLGILKPVIENLASASSQLTTLVPEARARASIASALTLMQTTLNTIQLTLAAQ